LLFVCVFCRGRVTGREKIKPTGPTVIFIGQSVYLCLKTSVGVVNSWEKNETDWSDWHV
jgi:hypothetical protein